MGAFILAIAANLITPLPTVVGLAIITLFMDELLPSEAKCW